MPTKHGFTMTHVEATIDSAKNKVGDDFNLRGPHRYVNHIEQLVRLSANEVLLN